MGTRECVYLDLLKKHEWSTTGFFVRVERRNSNTTCDDLEQRVRN